MQKFPNNNYNIAIRYANCCAIRWSASVTVSWCTRNINRQLWAVTSDSWWRGLLLPSTEAEGWAPLPSRASGPMSATIVRHGPLDCLLSHKLRPASISGVAGTRPRFGFRDPTFFGIDWFYLKIWRGRNIKPGMLLPLEGFSFQAIANRSKKNWIIHVSYIQLILEGLGLDNNLRGTSLPVLLIGFAFPQINILYMYGILY